MEKYVLKDLINRIPSSKRFVSLFLMCSLVMTMPAIAVSPEDLKQRLDAGDKVTVIDLRSPAVYARGHIHNAINIPALLIDKKRLPPLGKVVVYDDGVDESICMGAMSALNQKAGIDADVLVGGFDAWLSSQRVMHTEQGLSSGQDYAMSYEQLNKLISNKQTLILTDIRSGPSQSDLEEVFGLESLIISPADGASKVVQVLIENINKKNDQLIVLVADKNTFATVVANKLHAAGIKRVRVLIGGNAALRAKGKPVDRLLINGESRDES